MKLMGFIFQQKCRLYGFVKTLTCLRKKVAGPQGLRWISDMKTVLHVNQHNIRANAKGADLPVLTVKDYKQNRKCNEALLMDNNGVIIARLVYSPDKPLSCGAKVWIETELEVLTVE